MKRLLVLSILGALLATLGSNRAEAQLFRRWRSNNGYYNTYRYNSGYNNGNYRGYRSYSYAPGSVPGYTTGGYTAVPSGSGGGYSFNGPNVAPGPAGRSQNPNLPVGAGANPQYGAAPGGVGAGFGAGMGPAGSKLDSGTGTVGRP